MDPLTSDSYSAYSDPSTPRTPSPTDVLHYPVFANDYKGSLLNELYEQDIPPEYNQVDWQRPQSDYPIRRATFPYVRHDQSYPSYDQQQQHYPRRQEPTYPPYHDFVDPSIKLEDSIPIMVQQQSNVYRSPPSCHQVPMPYLSPPHNNLPVQHTDDAASKETQYLRRRCFNCHTTEPPSWRRSTLNPGKIVCNKCGLYERTHLRARPLRFDELRSRSKCRKPSKSISSPKQSKIPMIKKEPADFGLDRPTSSSSVSSASSVHSGFSRDSHSPPQDGGIRLPNNPLSDVASMLYASSNACLPQSISRKSHTSPPNFYSPPSMSEVNLICQVPDYYSHPQNGTSPEGLWVECTEINGSGLVSSPTASSWKGGNRGNGRSHTKLKYSLSAYRTPVLFFAFNLFRLANLKNQKYPLFFPLLCATVLPPHTPSRYFFIIYFDLNITPPPRRVANVNISNSCITLKHNKVKTVSIFIASPPYPFYPFFPPLPSLGPNFCFEIPTSPYLYNWAKPFPHPLSSFPNSLSRGGPPHLPLPPQTHTHTHTLPKPILFLFYLL